MRIAIGADHGGFQRKNELVPWLQAQGHEIFDLGARVFDPADDYPDITEFVARLVASGRAQRGIIICGSGVGACIAANKVPGVRACLCHDTYSAHQGVEHDDMTVLCLGARIVGMELTKELITAFLNARFSTEPQYRRRLGKVLALEAKALQGKPL
jgi:ribose 5-phosphate isomerase B